MEATTYRKLLSEIEKLRGERIETFNSDDIRWTEISDKTALADNPLVSVPMITYNHERWIGQAIEGILSQKTDFSIELVIGEDCSTDRTREIVMKYQQKHPAIIRVITSDQNIGAKKNIQRTFQACRGKYLAVCEGDDYWHHPQKIQLQCDCLESHPEIGLVTTDYDAYHQSRNTLKRSILHGRNGSFDTDANPMMVFLGILSWQFFVRSCTVMVRKQLLNQIISSDPELHLSNRFLMGDPQRWAEMALVSKVHHIDLSTATYRVLPNSASHSRSFTRAAGFNLSMADLRVYLTAKHGCDDAVVQRFWNWYLRSVLWYGVFARSAAMIRIAAAALSKLSIEERLLSLGRFGWPVAAALCHFAKFHVFIQGVLSGRTYEEVLTKFSLK